LDETLAAILIFRTPDMVQELMCGQRQHPCCSWQAVGVEVGVSLSACQSLSTAACIVMPVEETIPNPREKAPSIIARFGCNS
jgi:hypothetical protein